MDEILISLVMDMRREGLFSRRNNAQRLKPPWHLLRTPRALNLPVQEPAKRGQLQDTPGCEPPGSEHTTPPGRDCAMCKNDCALGVPKCLLYKDMRISESDQVSTKNKPSLRPDIKWVMDHSYVSQSNGKKMSSHEHQKKRASRESLSK